MDTSLYPSLNYKKKTSEYLMAFVLMFLVGAGVLWVRGFLNLDKARLDLDINGRKRSFEGEVTRNMTVIDVIQAAALAGNISLALVKDENGGFFIRSIDGYSSVTSTKKLDIYLNSSKIDPAKISSTIVRSGDKIIITTE